MTTSRTAPSGTGGVLVRPATTDESAHVAWLAALTFPLACPPGTPVATMAAHVAAHLTPADFAAWTVSDRHALLVASADGGDGDDAPETPPALLGYALVAFGEPEGAEEREVLRAVAGPGPYAELSKIYAHPHAWGTGVATRLMTAAVDAAGRFAGPAGVPPLWLGTNGQNGRAQAFYRKHGFELAGTRTYDVGGVRHDDVVMLRHP